VRVALQSSHNSRKQHIDKEHVEEEISPPSSPTMPVPSLVLRLLRNTEDNVQVPSFSFLLYISFHSALLAFLCLLISRSQRGSLASSSINQSSILLVLEFGCDLAMTFII
jgi:hypothetical protein